MADTMPRRTFLARSTGLALAATVLPPLLRAAGSDGPVAHAAEDNAARAAEAYAAMQKYFYIPSAKLYRENYPHDGRVDRPYSFLWAFEEAARATLCVYGLPGRASAYARAIRDRLSGREAYSDGRTSPRAYRSYPRVGDRYYDDNSWAGSDLVQHFLLARATGGPSPATALQRARGVLAYVQTGWDESLPKPGGVRWVDATFNGDRGTGPTGGAARLAAQLYEATGRQNRSYLDWAIKAYAWAKRHLLAPNRLYWDNIRADGAVDADQWIYNQGVMLGAAVLLHRLTRRAAYLQDATRVANAALAFYGAKADGTPDPDYNHGRGYYSGQGIFNAIFFRNLLRLYAVTRNATYLQKIQAYADHAWSNRRDPTTGLFRFGGTRYSLLDHAGTVQVLACLGWDPANFNKLT